MRVPPDDEHNAALVERLHPPAWANPEPAERYNLVVLGAGPAGLVAAAGAAGLGARVALVEKRLLGGDCLNVGCVPSKALLRCARALADVRDAGGYGVVVPPGARVDFPRVMERMRRLRAGLAPHDSAERFRSLGVDVFFGEGRFVGPDSIEVDGRRLRFAKAVVATGTRPTVPPIPGLAEAGFVTNETLFTLTELPPRLAIVGAGPIGCEMAQAFARFGSAVTLLEMMPQILPREDADAAERVERALARDGVRIIVGCKIDRVERTGTGKLVRVAVGGKEEEIAVDEVLAGAGRAPNVEGIGLEVAGVRHDPRRGVEVDDFLRTTNRRVYAAGDVASPYKFTHAADAAARIVLENALFLGRRRASALTVPWCTYTDPEIAHVGLYEKEARERGFNVETLTVELKDVDRAILDGETDGFVRVHVERRRGRIRGATIVARHAGEMIGEAVLAMTAGVDLRTIARTIHPYPTQADALKKLGDLFVRRRLTPGVRGIFERWLRWRR